MKWIISSFYFNLVRLIKCFVKTSGDIICNYSLIYVTSFISKKFIPNKSKCEIASLGALKGVKLAHCGIECIDLMFNAIKILGVYYSYDKSFKNKELYKSSSKN